MQFQSFVLAIRKFNSRLTESQIKAIWETFLPFPIQDAIEKEIAVLKRRSLNLNGDPYGQESRTRSQFQHWIAYQGSSYPVNQVSSLPGEKFFQSRKLTFEHYVEVEDLRRDWQQALLLHETLKTLLAGFSPCQIKGVIGALHLISDGLISARSENETVYRYKATYQIDCTWRPTDIAKLITAEFNNPGFDPNNPDYDPNNPNYDPNYPGSYNPDFDSYNLFLPKSIEVGLFHSQLNQVGESAASSKFTDIVVKAEEEEDGSTG